VSKKVNFDTKTVRAHYFFKFDNLVLITAALNFVISELFAVSANVCLQCAVLVSPSQVNPTYSCKYARLFYYKKSHSCLLLLISQYIIGPRIWVLYFCVCLIILLFLLSYKP